MGLEEGSPLSRSGEGSDKSIGGHAAGASIESLESLIPHWTRNRGTGEARDGSGGTKGA